MRPETVFGIQASGIVWAESLRGTPQPLPAYSTSSTSMPAVTDRMYAMATRPVAASMPIAGRRAFRPLVTAAGALHAMPSGDVETNTEFWVEPGALQSCQVTHTRPPASTSADGSGNARKPRTPHDAETSAIHAGPLHVAPPSVDLDAAIEKPFSSQRKATTSSPVGRITGNAPTPGRTPRSTPADQVAPPSSDQRTASMSDASECV